MVLAMIGMRLKSTRASREFSVFMCGISLWTLGYLLGFFDADLRWKLLMLRFEYLGNIIAVVFWLLFVLRYTQMDSLMSRRNLWLLAIIPAATYLQILFIGNHQFYYLDFGLAQKGSLMLFQKTYGPGFFIWVAFAYALVITGSFLLFRAIVFHPKLFKAQILPLSIGAIFPIIPNIMYITGANPIAPNDPTPLCFSIVGIVFLIQLKRFRFFDLLPMAHFQVFKSVKAGVIIVDTQGRMVEVNPKALTIFKKEQKDILGKMIDLLIPQLADLAVTGERLELTLGDEGRTYEAQVTAIENARTKEGFLIMLYDITRIKKTIDALNAYASSVSHDLKNPLSRQLTSIALLQKGGIDDHMKKELYDAIYSGALKMNQIIESLLLLATVRTREEVPFRQLDMQSIVQSAIKRVLDETSDSSHIAFSLPDEWPEAYGYEPWIEEVWVNYVSNAIKYGGSPPKITIGSVIDGQFVKYWVQDNGAGLTRQEQDALFKEFKRLEKHRSFEGHGLGLSLVKQIINKMNGEVGIESDGQSGSTFYFTLPVFP